MSVLRGAAVEADAHRVGAVISSLCVALLSATVVVLVLSGIDKNDQINELRSQGVPVEVTISHCLGLMGGSGSNSAGYSCKGFFILDGRRHSDQIPGTALHPVGSRFRAVAVPGDPGIVSTPQAIASEHASWTVFIVPSLLVVVLGLFLAVLARMRPRYRAARSSSLVLT